MICIRCLLSRKTTFVFSILPRRSHVDVLRTVDEDVADRRVLEQHFQGPRPNVSSSTSLDQPLALVAVQQGVFGVAEVLDHQANFAAERVAFQLAHPREIELIDELAVDALFELLVVALFRIGRRKGVVSFPMGAFRLRRRGRRRQSCKRELMTARGNIAYSTSETYRRSGRNTPGMCGNFAISLREP